MSTRGFLGDAFETVTDIVPYVPGLGSAANELGDFVGDATDFVGNPSAGDFFEVFTPAVAEDVFDGGGLDDFGGILPGPLNDIVNGGGFYVPFVGTIGPNAGGSAPSSGSAPPSTMGCPPGFSPNPLLTNVDEVNLRSASLRAGPLPPRCVPNNTNNTPGGQQGQQGQQGQNTGPNVIPPDTVPGTNNSGLDENCNERPAEYPAPQGCIPTVAAEHTFFNQQKNGCISEWKNLQKTEAELKARYEQLCLAREKFNQRTERYGDQCGPYELLYGIEEAREKLEREKAKAKKECMEDKKQKNCCASCSTGGGCGCSGHSHTTTNSGCGCGSEPDAMNTEEYEEPARKSCKREIEMSFDSAARPGRQVKRKITKAKKVRARRQPARTCAPRVVKRKARKAVTTKTKKRQCVEV